MDEAMEIFLKYGNNDIFDESAKAGTSIDGSLALNAGKFNRKDAENDSALKANDSGENEGLHIVNGDTSVNGTEVDIDVVYDQESGTEKRVNVPMYLVKHASKILGLSHQTVRNYAYEISRYLEGGRTSDGILVLSADDISLIGDVFEYCKKKGFKKSIGAKSYFENKENDTQPVRDEKAPVVDIRDKFMESIYEKLDQLTDVMVRISGNLDDNRKVIESFGISMDDQNQVITELREEIAIEREKREDNAKAICSGNDAIKKLIKDTAKNKHAEIIKTVSNMSAAPEQIENIEKTVDETRGIVKGIEKVINRIESKISSGQFIDADTLNKMFSENNIMILDKVRDGGYTEEKLVLENSLLRSKVDELELKNKELMENLAENELSVRESDIEELLEKNEELAERTLHAEEEMKKMAEKIAELEKEKENSSAKDKDIYSKNLELKERLEKTQTAFKNISDYVKKIENGEKVQTSDNEKISEENTMLRENISKAESAMKKMALRIKVLEAKSDNPLVEIENLTVENADLKKQLIDTRTAFKNISEKFKEIENQKDIEISIDKYNKALEENKALKTELDETREEIRILNELNNKTSKNSKKADKKNVSKKKEALLKEKSTSKDKPAKKGLFGFKSETAEASHLLQQEKEITTEEIERIERNASKLDITDTMPDIDIDEKTDYSSSEEWHDEIEDIPDGLFGFNDIEDGFDLIEIETAKKKDNVKKQGANKIVKKKSEEKKGQPAKNEKKIKTFFGTILIK